MIHSDLTAAAAAEHRNDLLRAATREPRTRPQLSGHHPPGHA